MDVGPISEKDRRMSKSPPIKPLVVSVAEAALMLNLSRAMIYKLVADGAFPLIKIAGIRSAIPVAAIEEYVTSCPVGVGEFPKKKNTAAPPSAEPAEPRTEKPAAANVPSV
jgi:excisionase family DNA binding protein